MEAHYKKIKNTTFIYLAIYKFLFMLCLLVKSQYFQETGT